MPYISSAEAKSPEITYLRAPSVVVSRNQVNPARM
jgi:hypothetical protein